MPYDIFISYSRRNLAVVKLIKEELEALGFTCWMDLEGIESGSEEFSAHIAIAINDAKAFIFFLSTSSQKSEWSLKEMRFAKAKDKHVVIVRFNDCGLSDVFSLNYGGDDIVDWRILEQKEKLLRDLEEWIGEKTGFTRQPERKATSKRKRKLPISIGFEYIDFPMPPKIPKIRFYQLCVENHICSPIDVTVSVINGDRRKEFRRIIAGKTTERFRILGGSWRFTHGDHGTVKVLGWAQPLKFSLEEDGVLIT